MQRTPEDFMGQALALARQGEGRTCPNPAVGAVVVVADGVVGEGFHPQAGQPHAEIFALAAAGEKARGADLYVTLEPCCHTGRTGPCADAVIAAGIARVWVGTLDPNPLVSGQGVARLQQAGLEVVVGVLEQECRRLIAPFAKHVLTGLPYVTLKAALTLDGNIATATGESRWITGAASRDYVHRLRDRCDAIMVGIGTVLADNPSLTTRLPEGGGRDPMRIIVDSHLRIPEDSAVLAGGSHAGVLIATTNQAPAQKTERLRQLGAEVVTIPGDGDRVDVPALLALLGARGIQHLLLEGGGRLNSAVLGAGRVDRILFFLAPVLLGGQGRGVFAGTGAPRLADAVRLQNLRVERFGDDTLIEGEVCGPCSPD